MESRHEVAPIHVDALVPGPGRDQFLFYHRAASGEDVNGLWDYCRFCVSNLVWVNDHFVVTPNPLYLEPVAQFEQRMARVVHVLRSYFWVKRVIDDVPLSPLPLLPA